MGSSLFFYVLIMKIQEISNGYSAQLDLDFLCLYTEFCMKLCKNFKYQVLFKFYDNVLILVLLGVYDSAE